MLWLKALHLIFMVTWFAGLFYLPRLFVYHAMSEDEASIERFKVMERKLFYGIMTPGALLTLVFGFWTLSAFGLSNYTGSMWMPVKLGIVLLTLLYHVYCGKIVLDFKHDRNTRSHVWFRWFNEIPVFFLIAIIILAVVRPI
ncbi:MAG: TIGR00701 family protein [Gammaproteobacteria bacterium]|nr:TIGR00701 family protein [Gammaproteobacteria bacterium]